MRRPGIIVGLQAAAAVLAVLVMACGPVIGSAPPSPVATETAAATTQPSVTTTPGPTPAVSLDPSLLGVLPATVNGLPVVESPEAEAASQGDPELEIVGTAMAAGLALDSPSGEFVYAVVVRLKRDVMNDNVFRDWRDTFDEGACSQANGVAGNAQAEIDGRTVYIGTCGGGVRTYHVWLDGPGLLVSASAVGDHRFGELLMNTLRVP